jgi:hypothetical protein
MVMLAMRCTGSMSWLEVKEGPGFLLVNGKTLAEQEDTGLGSNHISQVLGTVLRR